MDGWTLFWAIVLGASLTGFSVLALVVTLGGWKELKELLAKLKRESDS